MSDNAGVDKEKHTKQLKRKMECWREVILPLNSILLWERSWYPGLIVGITTFLFLMVWMLEPAILTIISVCLLVLALVDYLVPIVTSTFCPADNWTGQKEKKLNEICLHLSTVIVQVQNLWQSLVQARNNRRNIYYGATTAFLVLFAWLGSTINNSLLLYITVNAILLVPGFRRTGLAQSTFLLILNYITRRKIS